MCYCYLSFQPHIEKVKGNCEEQLPKNPFRKKTFPKKLFVHSRRNLIAPESIPEIVIYVIRFPS